MSFFNDLPSSSAKPPGASASSLGGSDLSVPLHNLSTVQSRMDTLHKFLLDSVNRNTLISKQHMDTVSSEITSAIHQTIVNGAALLACTQNPITPSHQSTMRSVAQPLDFHALTKEKIVDLKMELLEEEDEDDYEIIEIDAVEILAEHIHFCDICGKGFKRDANLRMHMRAHGNQYKTPEALAKPERFGELANGEVRKTRFSCPYVGCNRNKEHKKFRALKSMICVKNHFKRSHCPKMYSCNRCNKKSFSVIADYKNHLKHCGENKWKCSCGTSFSRKDKLFGHMTLFEGHMPAVMEDKEEEEEEKGKEVVVMVEDDEEEDSNIAGKQIEKVMEVGKGVEDNEFFDEFLDGLGPIDNYCFQDLLRSPNVAIDHGSSYDGIEGFFNF